MAGHSYNLQIQIQLTMTENRKTIHHNSNKNLSLLSHRSDPDLEHEET